MIYILDGYKIEGRASDKVSGRNTDDPLFQIPLALTNVRLTWFSLIRGLVVLPLMGRSKS